MPIPDQTALVARIKSELEARGQTFTSNEDSFQITARVAWALRSHGAKLITKNPAQNGAMWEGKKYSHDAISFPDGWVDCLVSAGPPVNENRPTWQWTPGAQGPNVADPIDLDAGQPAPQPSPQPEPEPEPGDDNGGGIVPLPDLVAIIQAAVETAMAKKLQAIADDLQDIKETQARGLGGVVLGYKVRIKP